MGGYIFRFLRFWVISQRALNCSHSLYEHNSNDDEMKLTLQREDRAEEVEVATYPLPSLNSKDQRPDSSTKYLELESCSCYVMMTNNSNYFLHFFDQI